MESTPPRPETNWVNLAGLVLALLAIAFLVRVYASHGRSSAPAAAPAMGDSRAAEQPREDERLLPFMAANDQFRGFYRQKRTELLAKQPLVIALSGDFATFVTSGAAPRPVRFTPAEYHVLKTFAHMALALNLALAGDLKQAAVADLKTLDAYAAAVVKLQADLPKFNLTEAQVRRQQELTDLALACLREMATAGDASAVLAKHNPQLRDLALRNAYDASKLQIDGLRGALADFAKAHPALDLKQARVVVSGVQPARAGNLQTQTIAKTLGLKPDSESLVYAEALFDFPGATGLLGTRLLDTDASRRIFGDGERLWRDLLADAATSILAEKAGP